MLELFLQALIIAFGIVCAIPLAMLAFALSVTVVAGLIVILSQIMSAISDWIDYG